MKLRFLVAVLALPLSAELAAQELNKCRDAAGKITYTSQKCTDLRLTPAGEVKGSVNVSPVFKPPPASNPAAQIEAAAPKAGEPETTDDTDRRCFSVKTAKGVSSRCNDNPEDVGNK